MNCDHNSFTVAIRHSTVCVALPGVTVMRSSIVHAPSSDSSNNLWVWSIYGIWYSFLQQSISESAPEFWQLQGVCVNTSNKLVTVRFNLMAPGNNTSGYLMVIAMDSGFGSYMACMVLLILFLMIFVYKTFKTTLQRLILYYVILSLWFEFSYSLRFIEVFEQEIWACIVASQLRFSAIIMWYTYIMIITNLSLLLVYCLLRGRPVSKQSIKYVECICVVLTVFTVLVQVVTFVTVVENDVDAKCTNPTIYYTKHFGALLIFQSIYMGITLEVLLVSRFLSIFF